jgi:glc operon protein GlcG
MPRQARHNDPGAPDEPFGAPIFSLQPLPLKIMKQASLFAASFFALLSSGLCPSTRAAEPAPLITRERIELNLAGAETIVAAAKAKAESMGVKVNIAVVDDGGHPLAFARMDGAPAASAYTAMTKAASAATFRPESGPLPPGGGEVDAHLSLSVQNAAAASGWKATTLKGGVAILVEGQSIGGVGVGGGTGEQDAEVAKAAIQALLEAIDSEIASPGPQN